MSTNIQGPLSTSEYPKLLDGLKTLSEDAQRGHLRNLCLTDLYFLLWFGCGRKDIEKQWLLDRCREVQAEPNDRLDLWARDHYKSTIITFGLTIQDILNDPEITVGIFSHIRPIAKKFLRQIKFEFESNERLKSLFPDVLWANPEKESPKWSEDEGIIVRRKSNPGEATVEAWGLVDGQPTGKHFSRLIYDDVVTEKSVTSPDMIEKTTDQLALSYNLGSGGEEKRRFIGTRYHFNDTYRTVMDRGTAKPRIYPATDDGAENGNPVLLRPERLAAKRRDMGPYVFGCQMLQNPKADALQGFRREWLRHWNPDAGDGMNRYILVDAASEKKQGSDYTAIWVVGLGQDQNYYVLDIIRDRLNPTERVQRLMALHRKWKPFQVRYEKYGKDGDISHIQDVQAKENYRFDIVEVGGATPKHDRIKRLIPLFEQNRVYLPQSLHITDYQGVLRDMVHAFEEEEYMAFPVPLHDDLLDSLARIAEPEDVKRPELALVWPMPIEDPYKPKDRYARKLHQARSQWAA